MSEEKKLLEVGKTEIGKILGTYNGQLMNMTIFYGNSVFPSIKKNGNEEFVHLKEEKYLKLLDDFLKTEEGQKYKHPPKTVIDRDRAFVIAQEKEYLKTHGFDEVETQGEIKEEMEVKDDKDAALAKMFAMRDDLNETSAEEQEEIQEKHNVAKEESIDPWNEEAKEPSKKKKLGNIQLIFNKSEKKKKEKVVEVSSTEKEQKKEIKEDSAKPKEPVAEEISTDEEYGATQLLEEEIETVESSFKLVDIGSGEVTYVNKPIFLLGCQKGICDMVIPQDVKTHVVSRKHAYILLKNDKAYIKDISSNGTFIGTESSKDDEFYKLPKDTEVELKNKQIIKLANIKLMFVF